MNRTFTFQEYDDLVASFRDFKTPVLWPTPDQVAMFEQDPDKWLLFCIYLSEYGLPPEDPDEKKGKQALLQFLYNHIDFIDNSVK